MARCQAVLGRRVALVILRPNAHLEVIPGRHAPFLDDPERCGTLINELLRRSISAASQP